MQNDMSQNTQKTTTTTPDEAHGLTGKHLRGALRKAVRSNGGEGKWVSYARNDELIAWLEDHKVPQSVMDRVDADEERKRKEAKVKSDAEARMKEAQRRALEQATESGEIDEAVESVAKVSEGGLTASFVPPTVDKLYHRTGTGQMIEWHLHACMPLIVTGPSGCSKTFPIMQECARLGRPMIRVNSNGGILPSTFLGRWTAKAGATAFAEGLLPLAMRLGIVVLVDEFDFAPPEISACLHPAMEVGPKTQPELFIPDTNARVVAQNGFVVLLTCNGMGDETGVYSGVAPVNGAITTRASRLKVDYPKVPQEAAMLRKAGMKKDVATPMARAMKDLRKAHLDDNSISMPPSLRQSIRIAHMTTAGWGDADAMPLWMAARCTLIEGMTNAEETVAEEILQRHGILSTEGPKFDPDAEAKADATHNA